MAEWVYIEASYPKTIADIVDELTEAGVRPEDARLLVGNDESVQAYGPIAEDTPYRWEVLTVGTGERIPADSLGEAMRTAHRMNEGHLATWEQLPTAADEQEYLVTWSVPSPVPTEPIPAPATTSEENDV